MSDSALPATNFQDLSALLSLLASDNVEEKLGNQSSYDWERMSSIWSTFGMIGVLRFYLKITAGLANSERAGVNLSGAAIYTAERTQSALCYLGVNRPNLRVTWRDRNHELISLMNASAVESAWLRPIFIAIGYSRCPWSWSSPRCLMEIVSPCLWAIFSMAVATLPTIILFPNLKDRLETVQTITLALQAFATIFAGTITPILIDRINPSGLQHIAQLHNDRFIEKTIPVIRDGDLVMVQSTTKAAHIVWQTPSIEELPRSGDIWWVRLLCVFNALLILGAYLGNYISLGKASQRRQYFWLGAQIFILVARYVMWSNRPSLSSERPPCLLYLATGSLVKPISAHPPPNRIPASSPEKISMTVIKFALTAAMGRAHSRFSQATTTRYRFDLYAKMVDTVPCDFISVEYVLMADFLNKKMESTVTVQRLSWAVVEECYAAQGVILGPNPWAFGGLYLGAVFLDDTFVGLTTVHPFQLHEQHCIDKTCRKIHGDYQNGGFTCDGYFITDLVGGVVTSILTDTPDSVYAWHDTFRSNVARCRSTAKANGPSYTEIHSSSSGLRPRAENIDVSRVEPTLNLDYIRESARHAVVKHHHDCRKDFCEIYTFGGNDVKTLIPPTSPTSPRQDASPRQDV